MIKTCELKRLMLAQKKKPHHLTLLDSVRLSNSALSVRVPLPFRGSLAGKRNKCCFRMLEMPGDDYSLARANARLTWRKTKRWKCGSERDREMNKKEDSNRFKTKYPKRIKPIEGKMVRFRNSAIKATRSHEYYSTHSPVICASIPPPPLSIRSTRNCFIFIFYGIL